MLPKDLKYHWILYNEDERRGRVGYYVTAAAYTYDDAKQVAKAQGTRLVCPVDEGWHAH